MNSFSYNEISVGLMYEFKTDIEEDKLRMFRDLSGDINPLHNDKKFAIQKGFNDRVVYGMLTSSYYSTLVGVYLPGEKCLIHEINLKFIKPVYIDDKLTIKGEVIEKNDTFKLLIIKGTIINQDGIVVSKAKIKVGVLG